MAFLFGDYELLKQSNLFDAEYYLATYPDVAKLNIDALTHYLELGSSEHRNPSHGFDTAFYLDQCRLLGEAPANALLHYVTVGMRRGLLAVPLQGIQIHIDAPRIADGVATEATHGGLAIAGWAHARRGLKAIEIDVDDRAVLPARLGIYRPDVAAAFPELVGGGHSGFSAHIPPAAISPGAHRVTVSARDQAGSKESVSFRVNVLEAADQLGPWSLRRRVDLAHAATYFSRLSRMDWQPTFCVVMALPAGAGGVLAFQRTLESLSSQEYPHWRLLLLDGKGRPATPGTPALTRSFGQYGALAARIRGQTAKDGPAELLLALTAGDTLGADALLEWAVASGEDRNAELIYCDERRLEPAHGVVEPFFKPGWSPNLLMATNYLGRAWCVRQTLLDRLGISPEQLSGMGPYAAVLKLSEAARHVRHLPRILMESGEAERADSERAALRAALKRRRIQGSVRSGRLPGAYEVVRPPVPDKVSVVIPVKTWGDRAILCIRNLRLHTRRYDLEVICVIDTSAPVSARRWIKANKGVPVIVRAPFEWGRFCNLGAAKARGRHLLFIDESIEVVDQAWLDALLQHAQWNEVGVVGPLIKAPDHSVAQAGIFLAADGSMRKAFQHLAEHDPGYFGMASLPRNVLALGGECLLLSRERFTEFGGFDQRLARSHAAADLCLRMRERGLTNVVTPRCLLLQPQAGNREDAPRALGAEIFRNRWADALAKDDPYLNANLTRDQTIPTVEREYLEVVHGGARIFAAESIKAILVVKLDHIGDCVTALPAVRRLRRHFPNATIVVLCASGTTSVWNAEPAVSETIEFNFFNARSGLGKLEVSAEELRQLGHKLAAKAFDIAIDLRKQPDTRHLLAACGARYRAGFDHQGRFPWLEIALEWDEDVPLRRKHGHVSNDLVALVDRVAQAGLESEKIADLPGTPELPRRLAKRLSEKPFICIHAAAGSVMRQWPTQHFAAIIDLFLSQERFNVAVLGSEEDSELIRKVLAGSRRGSGVINLTGRVSISDLPGLLARAVLFVGNNSGPHHIAASLGVPTVGIHSGVVDAVEWAPLGPQAVAVRRRMSCSPCFLEKPEDCQRGLACLTGMSAADIFAVSQSLLPPDANH